jgi:protein-S-isoprenylcysteine O-methyltransferase Ste14
MRRWLLPGAFAVVTAVTADGAVHAIVRAGEHPGGRAALLAGYHVLRTMIVLAFTVFTIDRAEPHRRARSPLAIGACAVAMGCVFTFSAPARSSAALVLAGDTLATFSCLWLLASVLALGRCFGVLPEARGLVTRGPYRLVRHPVYLGEIGACVGLVVAAPTLANALILVVLCAAQWTRMLLEERALSAAFSGYAEYASRTPRVLPRIAPLAATWTGRTVGSHASTSQRAGVRA